MFLTCNSCNASDKKRMFYTCTSLALNSVVLTGPETVQPGPVVTDDDRALALEYFNACDTIICSGTHKEFNESPKIA
ncbi:hypothetical protein VTP01DRAFT_7493 [Rhizomucor pusillus]|uniref:uncharacterized protein n=1 Tax=Rhizomucor pusillus TaxID=4840 RepID=UPI003743AF4C